MSEHVHLRLGDGSYGCGVGKGHARSLMITSVSVSSPEGLERVTCFNCPRSHRGRIVFAYWDLKRRHRDLLYPHQLLDKARELVAQHGQ